MAVGGNEVKTAKDERESREGLETRVVCGQVQQYGWAVKRTILCAGEAVRGERREERGVVRGVDLYHSRDVAEILHSVSKTVIC